MVGEQNTQAEKDAKTGSCIEGTDLQLPTMLLGALIGHGHATAFE